MFSTNYILILLIVDIVLSFFFGFMVLIIDHGWKKLINRRFFSFTVSAVIWQITNLMMFLNIRSPYDLFWTKLTYLTGIFVAYFMLRFIIVFPKIYLQNQLLTKAISFSGLIIVLVSGFLTIGTNTITTVTYLNGSRSPQYSSLFPIFAFSLIMLAIFIFIFAIINYIRSDKLEKDKMKYMIIGILSSLILIIFTDIVSPSFIGNNYLSNFDSFCLIFLFGFTFYAIVKHHLFDIRIILTETATILVSSVLLVETLLSPTWNYRLINVAILVLVIYGGYLIIKSVQREIKFREEMQDLSEQLAKANAHLKELDAMKTEFVSLASHELLTPVSAIEGYLSMILDEHLAKVEDPKAAQYLDRIYRSSRRLARLIADMLNISRIEEGRLLVEKKDVNLNELVTQTIEELKFKAEERKQKVVFDLKTQTSDLKPYMTYADPDKIKEVIVNIIGNSIKYSKNPGQISIQIEKAPTEKVKEVWAKIEDQVKDQPLDDQEAIKASVDEHYRQFVGDEQLLIIVKDQGIGIPKDELTKLFKKFHRVGDYSTEESQGTGLGLYISRSLVELHHGRIWADSDGPGKGSTFTFSLPDISDKEALLAMEKEVPNKKEQLKPLAKPMNDKIGEDI